MKKVTRSLSYILLALLLTLSVAVLPAINVHADAAFDHPVPEKATASDTQYMEELKALNAAHIHSFDVTDFTLAYKGFFADDFVDDDSAYLGRAAALKSESRQEQKGGNRLNMSNPDSFMEVALVHPDDSKIVVSSALTGGQLIADGSYHLYKLEDVFVHRGDSYKFLYLVSDWGFQLQNWEEEMACVANQRVDFYLSMKIEGDMSFQDASARPVYFIDRIIVASKCSESGFAETGSVEATCSQEAGVSGICPVCGETAFKYEYGTMLDHSFTNYITNEDGSQTAECDYGCGNTDTIAAPETEPVEETDPIDETTAPATETVPTEETTPTEETEPVNDEGDTNSGSSLPTALVVQIIFDIVIVALIAAAVVVVLKTGKKKLFLILIVTAIALMITVTILCITGTLTWNNASGSTPSNETSGDSAENQPTATKPTTPALTDENSLNLNNMKVVLPAKPTQVETNAAQELVDYVEKMTGQTIRIVKEGSAVEAGIYVGDTEFAKANNVTYPVTEYGEGWAIKAIDGNLVLCGESVRGTLYAVYHLLEDALGVHWWNYESEYVPSLEAALVWNEYDDSGAPVFQYRNMHPGGYINIESMFPVRNRLNGHDARVPEGYGGMEAYGSPVYVHSFSRYVPQEMFSEHPEWFSLVDGERNAEGQLCMTNKELKEYMTNKLLGYIESDITLSERSGTARPRWYAIVPGDMDMFCECADCVAVIEKSGMSGYLLQFVNALAEVVAVQYPDVLVDTLAYWQYAEPPLDDTKPADNVVIRFAWNFMDLFHSISHENNAEMLQWAQRWSALTKEDQLFYWDYLTTYRNSGPATFMYKFPNHFQTLAETGVVGYFGEMENPIDTDFWDMKMWLCAKLLEDPYQDFDVLVDTFVNGYYGAAGPYVKEYLDLAEARLANADYLYVRFGYDETNKPRWLSAEDVFAADEIFNKAFEVVGDDEVLLMRLRLARNCLDRAILERFEYYQHYAKEQNIDFPLDELTVAQRVVDCLTEQMAIRGQYDYTVTNGVNDYGWVEKYQNILQKIQYLQ